MESAGASPLREGAEVASVPLCRGDHRSSVPQRNIVETDERCSPLRHDLRITVERGLAPAELSFRGLKGRGNLPAQSTEMRRSNIDNTKGLPRHPFGVPRNDTLFCCAPLPPPLGEVAEC